MEQIIRKDCSGNQKLLNGISHTRLSNSMHTVAFFSNQFAKTNGTGVARYARSLWAAFAKSNVPFQVLPIATWCNMKKNDLSALQANTGLRLVWTGRWLTPLCWMMAGFPKLEQLLDFDPDIVHINDLGYPVATSKPYVVTVHDIGPLTHPEYFSNDSYWIMRKSLERAISKAHAFICVSKATADSLMEYVQRRYAADLTARTYIVHEGISENFLQAQHDSDSSAGCQSDLQEPFILAVGKISPRKNLETVIQALNKLRSSIPHHLITVGGNGWDFQGVQGLVKSLSLEDRVHFLGHVSDEMLRVLYKKATLFIFPSLFEGFGLPILESMASGCPVVASNVSSLPEIAGDAALLVDPLNVEGVATAIEAICKNDRFAAELRQKGEKRAKQFSWEKCAKETALVYERLLC